MQTVELQVIEHRRSHWDTGYGIKYGWLEDYGDLLGAPMVDIHIATDAPIDRRQILAHEACHILQMYHWFTWREGVQNLPPDHPLEVEAHQFAEREMAFVELDYPT